MSGSVAGGAVWVGALASNAFWPGTGTFTPGTLSPGSVIDRKLASPANGDNGSGGDGDGGDGDGTTPVDDVTLVVAEPTPGSTPGPGSGAAVIPEPGMLLLLGIAMVVLGLLRREWA